MNYRLQSFTIVFAYLAVPAALQAADRQFRVQEIETGLGVGYAVSLNDINEDGRLDIVVVDTKRVVWYENPSWTRHTLIVDQTKPDNVCIAPYDIDGDGKLDFALGADWRIDTKQSGTIQWLRRGGTPEALWSVHPIGVEPTTHRMRWADLDGDKRAELLVVPLMGRGASGPHWNQRALRILAYQIPKDPVHDPWPVEVIDEELHVAHNFWPCDLNADGRTDILVASFEGVSLLERSGDGQWSRTLIGQGNQETSPNRGASEVKLGRLADGSPYIATIEPWHGFQVVVYTPPAQVAQRGREEGRNEAAAPSASAEESRGTRAERSIAGAELWRRHVLDEQLQWGHAVWCANLDEDADEELIIGARDNRDENVKSGLRIYDPATGGAAGWQQQLVDPGGVCIEDLAAADLNGDGRVDIVAVGRQTHNVRIYWNEKP